MAIEAGFGASGKYDKLGANSPTEGSSFSDKI